MSDLFTNGDLSSLLRSIIDQTIETIDTLDADRFLAMDDDDLVREICEEHWAKTTSLAIAGDKTEVVRKDETTRSVRDYGRRVEERLNTVVIALPFEGPKELLRYRPSSFNVNPPEGRIVDSEIHMTFELRGDGPAALKDKIDHRVREVGRYVQWINNDLTHFKAELGRRARMAVEDRREELRRDEDVIQGLGLPVREQPDDKREDVPVAQQSGQQSGYDVFVSHASEDKPFVRSLADRLTAQGIKVWYDDSTLTVGDRLRQSIEAGLRGSRYGIVVVSHSFLSKKWPQEELDGLAQKENGHRKVILPIWHEIDAEEVRGHSPMLADRVALRSDQGLDYVVSELLRVVKET